MLSTPWLNLVCIGSKIAKSMQETLRKLSLWGKSLVHNTQLCIMGSTALQNKFNLFWKGYSDEAHRLR